MERPGRSLASVRPHRHHRLRTEAVYKPHPHPPSSLFHPSHLYTHPLPSSIDFALHCSLSGWVGGVRGIHPTPHPHFGSSYYYSPPHSAVAIHGLQKWPVWPQQLVLLPRTLVRSSATPTTHSKCWLANKPTVEIGRQADRGWSCRLNQPSRLSRSADLI